MGLLETKVKAIKANNIDPDMFCGWKWHNNFHLNTKARI